MKKTGKAAASFMAAVMLLSSVSCVQGSKYQLTDMLAFDRALFGGKLLNKESMEVLLTGG